MSDYICTQNLNERIDMKNLWINICDQYIQIYLSHSDLHLHLHLNLKEDDEAGDPGENHVHAVARQVIADAAA